MKTLYESILDDEDILIGNVKETIKNWFVILQNMISDPSCKQKDLMNIFRSEGFQKDIMSVFRNKSDVEILPITWDDNARRVGIFSKYQSIRIPSIEFRYYKDQSINGVSCFIMAIATGNMINASLACNIKSKQSWSLIPSMLSKKYGLKIKKSPFRAGEIYIYS